MQKAEIEFLKKRNLRYRILKTDSQYYLLDCDSPFFIVYFLPIFVYFFPHRSYPISQTDYQELVQESYLKARFHESMKQYLSLGRGLGTALAIMAFARVIDINQYLHFSPRFFSAILAGMILVLILGFRTCFTLASRFPAGFQDRDYQRVFIFPRFFKRLVFFILLYLFVLTFFGGIIYALLTQQIDNYILHINLISMGLLYLIMGNFFFLGPNNYWIKVLA